jgi:hypothetical protein
MGKVTSQIMSKDMIDSKNKANVDPGALSNRVGDVETFLTDISINFNYFNLKGTGTDDDSLAIQNIINQAATGKVKKILFPKANYLLTQPININNDDIDIDLNGSTIIWKGTSNLGNDATSGYVGIFNIKGTKDISFMANCSDIQPSVIDYSNRIARYCSKITLSSTDITKFSIGDYIFIAIDTAVTTSTSYNPRFQGLMQVIDISGNTLVLDAYSPHDYSAYLPLAYNSSDSIKQNYYIRKITPVKNVGIRNFTIDNQYVLNYPITKDISTTANPYDRNRSPSGVSTEYTVNVKIENVVGKNMLFPLIKGDTSNNAFVKHVQSRMPVSVGGGEGYVVKLSQSANTIVEFPKGIGTRHVVDYTACNNSLCKHGRVINSYDNGFTTHAMSDYNITFEDCQGQFNIGSGLSYNGIVRNFTYKDCSGEFFCFGDTSSGTLAENVMIDHCTFDLYKCNPNTIKIVNSEINVILTNISVGNGMDANYQSLSPNYTRIHDKTKMVLRDTKLTLATKSDVLNYNNRYREIDIKGGEILFDNQLTSQKQFVIRQADKIAIKDVKINGFAFGYADDLAYVKSEIKMTINENEIIPCTTAAGYLLNINNVVNCDFMLSIDKNKLKQPNNFDYKLIRMQTGSATPVPEFANLKLFYTINGNELLSSYPMLSKDFIRATQAGDTYTFNGWDANNIVKGRVSGDGFNATRNLLL